MKAMREWLWEIIWKPINSIIEKRGSCATLPSLSCACVLLSIDVTKGVTKGRAMENPHALSPDRGGGQEREADGDAATAAAAGRK